MHIVCRAVVMTLLIAGPGFAQVERNRGGATAGGASGADASKGIQRASVVVQLDFDPNRSGARPTIDTQTLNAMLTSTTLVDPAAKKALGLGPEAWPRVAQIELLPAGNVAVKLSVIVTPVKDVKLPENAAQALLGELTTRAKAAVDQAALRQEQAAGERRAAIENELAAAQQKLDKIQAQLRDARAMAGVATGGGGGGGDPFGRGVMQEMQQAEVNIAAQRARLKVIEEEIGKLAANGAGGGGKPQETPAQSDVKAAWDALIAARQKAVEAARSNAGNLEGHVALANAEAELAETKLRAAQASVAARPAGFDSPDRWQGERITLRASIAEQEARLGALSERLAVIQKKSGASATQPVTAYDIDRLQRDENRARQEVDELSNQLDQMRRERRGAGSAPKLLILDGRGDTTPKE